jgi:hypothetical protein
MANDIDPGTFRSDQVVVKFPSWVPQPVEVSEAAPQAALEVGAATGADQPAGATQMTTRASLRQNEARPARQFDDLNSAADVEAARREQRSAPERPRQVCRRYVERWRSSRLASRVLPRSAWSKPLTGVSTPAGTSTLKAEVRR